MFSSFSSRAKRTNNANNAIHYVMLCKKRRENSKRNSYMIFLRVIMKAIIIINPHWLTQSGGLRKEKENGSTHSSYTEGDHCPLRLSGLPAAHTFFWVIPQRPAPYFTVHSEGCLQPTPSSEWFLKARNLFHLVSEWFLKARTLFHCSLYEMQLAQDSVKKILYISGFSQKNLAQFVS